jgi:signal transduction histidine kinase
LNREQENIMRTFAEETARLSNIIDELLDLSQVETGHIRLNSKKTDAREIVRPAVEAVKFQAERKHVSIETEVSKDALLIQADMDKTIWVLVNFLTNAIRYSPEHGKVILRCGAENGSVTFSVRDFGPGIEKQFLGRLFEKFFQVPGTATGTGLGLAISKEFIEAQGGTVTVESEPGKGSDFSFQLPLINWQTDHFDQHSDLATPDAASAPV